MITLQHYLYKLISEEVLAFETYKVLNAIFYKKDKFQKSLINMFDDIAEDEYSDHANKLIDYGRIHNLGFPVDNSEYVRHASENAVKAFNCIPNTDDLTVLIEYALDLERDAIDSYTEAISKGMELDEFDEEIMSIMQHNLKDEQEHYDKILIAHAASQDLT